jgi:hypothetical protein
MQGNGPPNHALERTAGDAAPPSIEISAAGLLFHRRNHNGARNANCQERHPS